MNLTPFIATAAPAGSMYSSFIMLALFGVIFYFLLIRPQQKRVKQHKELVGGLQKGDEIVTNGGLIGRISKVKDDYLVVELAEATEVKLQKAAVAQILPKGTVKSISE